ncbi:MAG: helix-turn-helix transcriptional regulator [Fibrobacter sp.]|nr:helix-turn-helix transcriptional regulator [Fibrobacter sp.]
MKYDSEILTKVIQQTFLSRRRQLGMTQLGLSLESRITRQFISQVESGKRSPSIFTMSVLAEVSNQTLTELFSGIDSLYKDYEKIKEKFPSLKDLLKEESLNIPRSKAASQNKGKSYVHSARRSKKADLPTNFDP